MTEPKRTEPSQSLLQGMPYTNAVDTDLRAKWQAFFDYQKQPANADDYQRDAIADHTSNQPLD